MRTSFAIFKWRAGASFSEKFCTLLPQRTSRVSQLILCEIAEAFTAKVSALRIGVQVAALESLHSAALESLPSGFHARRKVAAPRWASAKRRDLQEKTIAPKNRLEPLVGRPGVAQRQALAYRHSAAVATEHKAGGEGCGEPSGPGAGGAVALAGGSLRAVHGCQSHRRATLRRAI